MSVIYCGQYNKNPYYIKEADINIYSIQELAYFIYNYSMLISNSFICKNLVIYIDKTLNMPTLSEKVNELYNKKASLSDILLLILENSNYYSSEEISEYRKTLLSLLELDEIDFINLAGDKLFLLNKYEKAITQYSKIAKNDDNALYKMAFAYAKLQFYESAARNLGILYKHTHSIDVLKMTYYAFKLNGTIDKIYDIESKIDEELLAEWEYDIVSTIIQVRKGDAMKEVEDIFLMGSNHIKQSMGNLIKIWKEKYRYVG